MILHNQPSIAAAEIKAVGDVLRSGQISQGPYVVKFEKAVAKTLGQEFSGVAVANGTTALYLALKYSGVNKKDKVIMPTYACSALLNATFLLGATPVLVDVNPNDGNISSEEAAKRVSPKVKAVIAPHMFGMPADMDNLLTLGVPVIEDCAQAIGATLKGKPVGNFGQAAIFSFYATKMMTTGQGGMVVSADHKLIDQIKDYREYDFRPNYIPRFNFQMTDVQAALGLIQLKRLDEFIARRRQIAKFYSEILARKSYITLPTETKEQKSCWYRYVIQAGESRIKQIKKRLDLAGIQTMVPIQTFELLHRYLKLSPKDFPQAEKLAETTLSLPIFPRLTDNQLKTIGGSLKNMDGEISKVIAMEQINSPG